MSTSKKLTLRFIEPVLLIGNRPPPSSTSRPPAVIHVIGIPWPSRFLRSSASMYYPEHKPKNKKRGRPGNETTQDTLGFHGNCQTSLQQSACYQSTVVSYSDHLGLLARNTRRNNCWTHYQNVVINNQSDCANVNYYMYIEVKFTSLQ